MNLNDWQQMTPRERDVLVATAVMGWDKADMRLLGDLRDVPCYTEDISVAFLVADEIDLLDKYGCAKLLGCDDGTWFVGELRDGQIVYCATAETAPLAICLAALKAIGVIE